MTEPQAPAGLALSTEEQAMLTETVQAMLAVLPAGAESPYADLACSVADGVVPAEQVPALERMCHLALQTGQARRLGRAEAERALTAVLGRTPAGRGRARDTAEVNRLLGHLADRRLRSARITTRIPGNYQLHLDVDGVQIVVGLDPDRVHVSTLQTG